MDPEASARLVSAVVAHILNGFLTIGVSQSNQAVDSFTRAVELNPASALAAHGLAEAHYSMGSTVVARHWYERALEIEPGFEPAAAKLNALNSN